MSIYGKSIITEGFISNYKKKKQEKKEQKEAEEKARFKAAVLESINEFIKWWNNPTELGDGYDIDNVHIANWVGISESEFCSKMLLSLKRTNIKLLCGSDTKSANDIKRITKSDSLCIILGNDDYSLIATDSKKIYEITLSNSSNIIEKFDYNSNKGLDVDKEDIIEAIKENNIKIKK